MPKSDTYGILSYMDLRHKYLKTFDFLNTAPQMMFMSGPRQSGKTTFAKERLKSYSSGCYFNWDIADDRKKIFRGLDFNQELSRQDFKHRPHLFFQQIK